MEVNADEIEKARLGIERERLELEKAKAEVQKKFFKANSGVLISAAVSLAAVTVSLSQVWVTKISKDKELEIAIIQKKSELEIQDRQKERELVAQDTQKKREWDLNAAKFITDNRKVIFDGTLQEQRLFAKIIASIYPPDIATSLLERIENASPPESKPTWREVRSAIPQLEVPNLNGVSVSQDKKYYIRVDLGYVDIYDVAKQKMVRRLCGKCSDDPISSAKFSPDGKNIEAITMSGKQMLWNLALPDWTDR